MTSDDLLDLGRQYSRNDIRNDSALTCFTIVANRYYDGLSAHEKDNCVHAMNNVACIYTYGIVNYSEAYRRLIMARDIAESNGLDSTCCIVKLNMGNLFCIYGKKFNQNDMANEARQLFSECFVHAKELQMYSLQVRAFINLCDVIDVNDIEEYSDILDPDIPSDVPDLKYARLLYQAFDACAKQRYAEARSYLEQQCEEQTKLWTPDLDLFSTLLFIAYTYQQEGNYEAQLATMLQAQQVAEKHDQLFNRMDVSQQISEVYRAMGHKAQADSAFIQYLILSNSLVSTFGLGDIEGMHLRHDLQIVEDQTQQLMMRHRIQHVMFLMALLTLLIFVGAVVLLLRKNRQLRLRNEKLYENNLQLLKAEEDSKILRQMCPDIPLDHKKYSGSKLSDHNADQLRKDIQQVMDQSEVFCQSDFSLTQLAQLVKSNKTYVSQVINETYGYSFAILLGNCRINEACRRINDQEHYGNYTLDAIADSVGIKSRVTFNSSFRRLIGLSPSEYQRMARMKHAEDATLK